MPPRKPFRRNRRGLSGAFIAAGLASLLYSGIFPLFRLFDYAAMGILMAVAGKIYRTVLNKMHQEEDEAFEREEKAQEERQHEEERRCAEEEAARKSQTASSATGHPEVDELILRGQQLLYKIREENERLPDPVISEQIDAIEGVANRIFQAVMEQPEKADQIRRFMDYYLPTTLKMLSTYRRMDESAATSETVQNTLARIRESLDMILEAFYKQLSQLYEEEALDIATDIDVLETMLKQDGLIDSGLKVRTSTGEEK